MPDPGPLDFSSLRRRYQTGALTVTELARRLLERRARWQEHNVWIHPLPAQALLERAAALDRRGPAGLPLYGIPFAVKDNIDVAGLPTTAAYPEPLYTAAGHAPVVERLLDAGALLVGKTNLDQFATGLNGTRSPYGPCANAFDSRYIAGGSSSGSAVAVAAGLAGFALGTDTAGSGRVPAAFNHIVGLKPSRGLLSTRGVVPACRSLDCVSIFALGVADSLEVLAVTAGYDPRDPFSRPGAAATVLGPCPARFRFGIPAAGQLDLDDGDAGGLFLAAVERLRALGGEPREVDLEPFFETARLLYEGPWVGERCLAVDSYLDGDWSRLLPVLRTVLEPGLRATAVEGFAAYYRLKALKRRIDPLWGQIDLLLTPTAPGIYTLAELEADPLALNSRLGRYTNFMNLLDLCGLALPAGFLGSGLPFGITLAAPAFQEARLAAVGAAYQQAAGLGAGVERLPVPAPVTVAPPADSVTVFVCGAHMDGLPLNHQLTGLGARLLGPCRTAPRYRFYALEEFSPPRPGLVRSQDGQAIAGELWELPLAAFGSFVAAIPPPLGIGKVELDDGRWSSGFICEALGARRGRDITGLGGWRSYLQASGGVCP